MCGPKIPKTQEDDFKLPTPPPPPPPPEPTAKKAGDPTITRQSATKRRTGKQSLRFDVGGSSGVSGINLPGV